VYCCSSTTDRDGVRVRVRVKVRVRVRVRVRGVKNQFAWSSLQLRLSDAQRYVMCHLKRTSQQT
jgi:hypothetical protein